MQPSIVDAAQITTPRPLRARAPIPARVALGLLVTLLSACGGGGGGGGSSPSPSVTAPPSVGAALTSSPNDAAQSAQAVVAGATAAAARVGTMSGLSAVFGAPVGTQSAPRELAQGASAPANSGVAGQRKHPLAAQTLPCSEFVDPPCTGNVVADTNIPPTAASIVPGNFFDLQFGALSGSLFGKSVQLNGHMRIDFLSTLALNATTFPGLDLQILLDGFSGSVSGVGFGPTSDLARLQINGAGVTTITAAGATYTGLDTITLSGNGNYTVGNATVRASHWSDATRFVELHLVNWSVAGGRPGAGSSATLSAASGGITLSVASSGSTSVVYAVGITAGGVTTPFIVTATYPAGGGAPSYVAVPG